MNEECRQIATTRECDDPGDRHPLAFLEIRCEAASGSSALFAGKQWHTRGTCKTASGLMRSRRFFFDDGGDDPDFDFGVDFGGGVNVKLGDRGSLYVEARYHYIWGPEVTDPRDNSTKKANGQFFPITFGVRF